MEIVADTSATPSRPIDKEKLLKHSTVFCMLPWTHLYVNPDGRSFACCYISESKELGNVDQSSIVELWNSERLREMRVAMLEGRPSEHCKPCYDIERSGSSSLRKHANSTFSHHFDSVGNTNPDGSVDKINLAYFDLRLSNVCNFKCRSCSPELSSAWAEDWKALKGPSQNVGLHKLDLSQSQILKDIEPFLESMEELYFAGGEPLLHLEHYEFLKLLIARKKTDIKIRYSTNLSKLEFGGNKILDLWKQFKNLEICVSFDASGSRAEYLRSGQNWEIATNNFLQVKTEVPHARLVIASTLGAYNSLHLPDFFEDWVNRDIVCVNQLYVNLLTAPSMMSLKVLPESLKQSIRIRYRRHIDKFLSPFGKDAECPIAGFEAALRFLEEVPNPYDWADFRNFSAKLDLIRGEKICDIFPELGI